MGNEVYLKNIANIFAGSSAPKEDYLDTEGAPFIRAGNLEELINGVDINTLAKINEKHRDKLKLKKASENSILFAKSGMSSMKNRVYKVEKESYFVNHLACVTVKDKNVDVDYLKYFFEWFKPSSLVRDESYPSIRLSDISNIKINLPSIKIQEKVAAILNETNKVLKLRQQQIETLSALKQSVFLDMFGDPRTNKYNYPLKSFSFFAEIDTNMINNFDGMEDFPHIGIGNIEKDSGQILSYETVREANIKSGKYLFGPNHIIYSKIRPNLNKVATPNFEGVCSADAYPILVKEDITTKSFFTYLLRSEYFLNYINSVSSRTNIPKVNKKQLEGFKGIYPPFYLQREFSEKVDIIDSNLKMMRDSLEDIEGLYNSLLHKAFNGELFKEEIKA